ncbi:MAG: hypothetical protein H6Q10_2708 [Acidobacteria bacterium]|nr:hypothetical protein [Acidobacteriota bacterium]
MLTLEESAQMRRTLRFLGWGAVALAAAALVILWLRS